MCLLVRRSGAPAERSRFGLKENPMVKRLLAPLTVSALVASTSIALFGGTALAAEKPVGDAVCAGNTIYRLRRRHRQQGAVHGEDRPFPPRPGRQPPLR